MSILFPPIEYTGRQPRKPSAMSKSRSLSRTKSLYNIHRDLNSLAQWAETQPDIFARIVTDAEIERLEEIVTYLVAGFEREMRKE